MECHYHPDRDATDSCAICGKSICKECGLEIAGKIYCKDCLEKIVGLGIENKAESADSIQTEPSATIEQSDDSIYQPQETRGNLYPQKDTLYTQEPEYANQGKAISNDSPYNIKDNIEYTGGLESSYLAESETKFDSQPQITQNEINNIGEITQEPTQEYIYPDHDYEPQPTSARQELENKYEKYLDDLYFDEEAEVPLNEQLAKDEEEFGSLTRRPYEPRKESLAESPIEKPPVQPPRQETPEEMEARIRAEIAQEMKGGKVEKDKKVMDKDDTSIHNINYKDEKEPMSIVDVLLTIILIIVILIVIYYLIYLFFLNTSYPTFMDALFGLSNPQNVMNNVLNH